MAFIRNTDKLVEGSSQLFFTSQRAKGAVQSDLNSLSLSISSEQSSRQSADSAMQLRLDVIEGSGVGSISKAKQDAMDYADQRIAALVNSAPAVLDTLKELSDALGGDANFAATIANQIGAMDDKVDQEIADRQSAVSALDARIDVLEADPVTKSYVDSSVSGEASARISAVTAEELARQSADSALSSRISDLEADPVTKTYVDGVQSSLDSRLDILEQDETTKAYVDGEISALDVRIDVLELDPVSKTYVDGEVSDLQGQISQEILDRQSAVSGEESRAMAAEGLLDGRLDVLEQDPTTKAYVDAEVLDLQGQITQEISDRQSAVSAEEVRAMAAEGLLDGRLDILEQDPTTKSYVDGEVSDLQGQVTQEISDRQSAIQSVEGMIEAEESRAMAAEGLLDGRLDVLEQDPTTKAYVDGIQSALDGRLDVLESDPVTKTYVDGEVSSLQGQVTTEKGRIDAILSASQADKDSFAEIVQLINSVDTANDSAFAGYVTSNNAALAQEVSDRQAADSALDLRLDALEVDPVTKAYVNSADNALDARLDALEADPTTKMYVDTELAKKVDSSLGFIFDESSNNATLKITGKNGAKAGIEFQKYSGFPGGWPWFVGISGYASNRLILGGASNPGDRPSFLQGSLDGDALVGSGQLTTSSTSGFVYMTSVAGTPVGTPTTFGGYAPMVVDTTNHKVSFYSSGWKVMAMKSEVEAEQSARESAISAEQTARAEAISSAKIDVQKHIGQCSIYTGSSISISSDDVMSFINMQGASSMVSVTLPSVAGMTTGRRITIKEQKGLASSEMPIRINRSGSEKIDGQNYYELTAAFESVTLVFDGSNWMIV